MAFFQMGSQMFRISTRTFRSSNITISAGDARTVYIDICDLLAGEGEECSADGETTFKSLIALLERLGLSLSLSLSLSDLKASDGASVMIGKHTGVDARFKEIDECKSMLSVHCICHHWLLHVRTLGMAENLPSP